MEKIWNSNFWTHSQFKVFVLIFFSLQLNCDIVFGKIFQIPGGKLPHELRAAFPASSTRAPILLNFENKTLVVSASHINPRGFDFSRIHQSPQNVQTYNKPVLPLVWVNLPFFDTPTFNSFRVEKKLEADYDKFQTDKHFPSKMPLPQIPVDNHKIVRRIGSGLIKSDWDWRDESESLKKNVSEPALKEIGRRIPLSLRGAETKNESTTTTTTSTLESQEINPTDTPIVEKLDEKDDHLSSESKTEELQSSSTLNAAPPDPALENVQHQDTSNLGQALAAEGIPHQALPSYQSTSSNQGSNYEYQYSVSEGDDVKSHSETSNDGVVNGFYKVLEADGYTRVVTYIADSSGFRASVKRVKFP